NTMYSHARRARLWCLRRQSGKRATNSFTSHFLPLTTHSLPSSARSAESGLIQRIPPKHLRLRDNDQLNRELAKILPGASAPTQVAIANLSDRVIHFCQRTAKRRQFSP